MGMFSALVARSFRCLAPATDPASTDTGGRPARAVDTGYLKIGDGSEDAYEVVGQGGAAGAGAGAYGPMGGAVGVAAGPYVVGTDDGLQQGGSTYLAAATSGRPRASAPAFEQRGRTDSTA